MERELRGRGRNDLCSSVDDMKQNKRRDEGKKKRETNRAGRIKKAAGEDDPEESRGDEKREK